jgi:hypothetical protein
MSWVSGWDKPIDPLGDCRFDRDGSKLTIIFPGRIKASDFEEGRLTAPRLLRDVQGDCAVQVRVTGDFGPANGRDREAACFAGGLLTLSAGLVLMDEKQVVFLERRILFEEDQGRRGDGQFRMHRTDFVALSQRSSASGETGGGPYLRLERRGDVLLPKSSRDGKEWQRWGKPLRLKLPPKLKVGVIAKAQGGGTW